MFTSTNLLTFKLVIQKLFFLESTVSVVHLYMLLFFYHASQRLNCPQQILIFSKNVYLQIKHPEVFSTSVAALKC
jgi:hypothetical protein